MHLMHLPGLSRRIAIVPRLVVLLLLTAGVPAYAQTDLSGFWVFRVPTGDGNFRESFFDLKQDGEVVTGKMVAGTRELPVAEGTFKGGALHFTVTLGNPPQTRQVVYDGALEGEKIRFT